VRLASLKRKSTEQEERERGMERGRDGGRGREEEEKKKRREEKRREEEENFCWIGRLGKLGRSMLRPYTD
jgi:hypothetical protein